MNLCDQKDHLINNLEIPSGVTSIPDYAFMQCSIIKEISLPNTLEEIGERAFEDCRIAKITIPKSVRNIGKHAFYTNSLFTVISLMEEPPFYNNFLNAVFHDKTYKNGILYVPTGTLEKYKKYGWNNFLYIEEGAETME